MKQRRYAIAGGIALIVAAAVVAGALFFMLPGGRRGPSFTPPGFVGGTGPAAQPPPGGTGPPGDASRRVADILTDMHSMGFNPGATPPKNSGGVPGGLFINWGANWDGSPDSAGDNTNYGSNGQTDSAAGAAPRHDEFTDLLYLRNLYGFAAAHPADKTFATDIGRMNPVVRSDFSHYTYYKCSLYGELRDLDRFDPGQGWGSMADAYATAIYQKYYSPSQGTIADPAKSPYRVDYASECAVALTDAGRRLHDSGMTAAGISTAGYLLSHTADPATHLLPLQASFSPGARDTVVQAQVKVGDEAQILDAMLSMYALTQDTAYLTEVHAAVTNMYSDGLHDDRNGGFYFSIDSDGSNLQSGYKETRQAWMLAVLDELERYEPGQWTARRNEMFAVVRDRLWQPSSGGYVYRVTTDFKPLTTNGGPDGTPVTENWVTAEAMDIAGQVLEG